MAEKSAKEELQQVLRKMDQNTLVRVTVRVAMKYGVEGRAGLWEKLSPLAEEIERRERKQKLLEEIKLMAGGYVVGKRPGSNADFHVIDRFSGKQASMDVFQIVRKPKRSPHHAHKYAPKKSLAATFKSVQPAMKKLDENTEKGFFLSGHTFFGFISQCYNEEGKENRDGFGRPYSLSVIVLLPHVTAEKLFEFIMREDPNIIQDVYQALFPATCDINRIKLVKGMNFEREGQKYRVPNFTPKINC